MSSNGQDDLSARRPLPQRLLIVGPDSTAGAVCDLVIGGLLHALHNHATLKALEPVVVGTDPERIRRIHRTAAVNNDPASMVNAALKAQACVVVGKLFENLEESEHLQQDLGIRSLLAAQMVGIPTAVLGAGVGQISSAESRKALNELLQRADLVTVRDQTSAISLARMGLSCPITATADLAFCLPPPTRERKPTGTLGIALSSANVLTGDAATQVSEAVVRLRIRFSLAPMVFACGGKSCAPTDVKTEFTSGESGVLTRMTLEDAETVDLGALPSVEAMLDAVSTLDLLITTEYYMLLAAGLCGVPALAIAAHPAVAALAQQLRMGNYVVQADKINAPAMLQSAQYLLTHQTQVRDTLIRAVQARSTRAWENLDLLAHAIEETPRSTKPRLRAEDCSAALRSLAYQVAEAMGDLHPAPGGAAASGPAMLQHAALPAEPLVTIYICAYNAAQWIEQAVASALGQTYRNLEILVVDDGSTDDTAARVRKFGDPRINLHQIEHAGLAGVRTYAKEHFRGDLIVDLDADDWIAPELIAKQVALLQAHPKVDVTYCDYTLVDASGNPTGVVWNYADYPERNRLLAEMFQAGCSRVPNGSMMERAEVVRRVGGYDPILKTAVDFEYLAKLAGIAEHFRGVHEPLYFYRSFGAGHSGNYTARNFTVTTVLRRLWDRYGGELLLGAEIGHGLSGRQKESAYLCRAGDVVFRHGETYISRGAPDPFFELAGEFYRDAFARDSSNVAAHTRLMQLAALGYDGMDSSHESTKRKTSRADTLYANQPELDILFETIIPELAAERRDPITVTVFDEPALCGAYTLAIEAARRGLPADKLHIHAVVPESETTDPSRPPAFPHTAVFNDGLNHMPADTAGRFFTKLPDGRYQLADDVDRRVDITHASITDRALVGIVSESDIVIAQTIWDAIDPEAAKALLAALIQATRPNGILFLGGYQATRHAALLEHPELEPVATRFEDVHDGWRYRRTVYGRRPDGLGPIDRRWPDWPRRYGAIFRRRQTQESTPAGNPDLKTYWMERGKVYKNQYPAKPLETQPVPHRLIQALQDEKPSSVLDYGCGFGKILREVGRVLPDARFVGLDISGSVLADSHQFLMGGPPVGLVEGNGKTIPCLPDSFEVTFTHVTLIHVPHDEIRGVLGELVRVTRRTLYIGETADTAHESFYYFAHDYPALFAELGLRTEELEVPNVENQPGARLYRVDVTGKNTRTTDLPTSRGQRRHLRLLVVSDRRTVHTKRFCRYFLTQGHEVHLYDTKPAWDGFEGIIQHWVDPVRFPEPDLQTQFFTRVARLREIIRTFQPDWVHGHFLIGWGWWAALASHGVPLALTAWGSDVFLLPREAGQVQSYTRWAARLADLLTADSTSLANATAELAGGHKQVLLAPFGIDTELFRPDVDVTAARQRLLIPEDRRVILSPRQIKPGANIETVIEAFAVVARQVPNALLVLKTYLTAFEKQSEYMGVIRKKISDLNLWDRIRVVHDVPDDVMPALYALADVSLSVRDTDGTPCTLFESSAAGTPVIAANIPSLAEWITDGENGFLVPLRDAPATAEAVLRVLAGGPDIERVRVNARAFAIAEGNYRTCFARIEDAYRRTEASGPGRRTTLQDMMGRRARRIDMLNAARADLCTALDRGEYEHALRVFNTIPRLLPENDFDEIGNLMPEHARQPA